MNHPKFSVDLTTAAMYEHDRNWFKTIPMYLGSELIKIVCRELDPKARYFARAIPSTFTVHKTLLCRNSRYFHNWLGRPFDEEIVANALKEIEASHDKYLSYENVPEGYIPSWVTFAKEIGLQATEYSFEMVTNQEEAAGLISLPNEYPHFFAVFIHWLYTQRLEFETEPWCNPEDQEFVYAQIYCLAERLDVPELRQNCYAKLREIYGGSKTMPDARVVAVIIQECSKTSLLFKYVLGMVAHGVISNTSKEKCDEILELNEDFAAEVAIEIMTRLRSDLGTVDPNQDHEYEIDDSDSDVGSSVAEESEDEYDADDNTNFSEVEDLDSLFGEAGETGLATTEGCQVKTEATEAEPPEAASPNTEPPETGPSSTESSENEPSDGEQSGPEHPELQTPCCPTQSERTTIDSLASTMAKTNGNDCTRVGADSSQSRKPLASIVNSRKRKPSYHHSNDHARPKKGKISTLDLTHHSGPDSHHNAGKG